MHRLRHATQLARFVLAWFVLALGVAVASPLVKPGSFDVVCTGSGAMKLVAKGDDGGAPALPHLLDCPLCSTAGAPPPVATIDVPPALPLGRAVQSIPAARIAALTAAPLPARGPPGALLS